MIEAVIGLTLLAGILVIIFVPAEANDKFRK
jgi:hypothetical protein